MKHDSKKRTPFLHSYRFDICLMILPMVFLLLFSGFPIIYTVLLSFQEIDPFKITELFQTFVGFDNYRIIFDDFDFHLILSNTVTFLFASVFFQLCIGFSLALVFQKNFPLSRSLRGLFLIPWIMPGLVVGAVWSWVFFEKGILNYILTSLHLMGDTISWMANESTSIWTIIIANIWLGVPFNMLLLSAALTDIPEDLYEAAKIDGTTTIQRFRHITLPLMKNAIFSVGILGIIFTLQQFDLFMALTQGGPSNASNVFQLWSWQLSFVEHEYGQGAAIATLLMLFMLVMSLFYVVVSSNSNTKEGK